LPHPVHYHGIIGKTGVAAEHQQHYHSNRGLFANGLTQTGSHTQSIVI